jgi:RHS repeat-associated protein
VLCTIVGLQYAVNRWYNSEPGRFVTADAPGLSEEVTDPGSWNAYGYVEGDSLNFNDPDGLVTCGDLAILGTGRSLRDAVTANSDFGILRRLVRAESNHTWSAQGTRNWFDERDAIAWSVVDRWKIVNGYLSGRGVSDPATLGCGKDGASITQIIGQPGFQYSTVTRAGGTARLRTDLQSTPADVLDGDPTAGDSVTLDPASFGLGVVTMTHECFDVW